LEIWTRHAHNHVGAAMI